MKRNSMCLVCLVLFAALTMGGCGVSEDQSARVEQTSHLRALVMFYNSAGNRTGRAPADESELKAIIQDIGGKALERLKISSPDDLFVSERDGQPFVVIYGKRPKDVSPDVAAYEQVGIDGVRQVGFRLGMIKDLDEQEFRKLVPEGAVSQ